jgi:hypothetical protein
MALVRTLNLQGTGIDRAIAPARAWSRGTVARAFAVRWRRAAPAEVIKTLKNGKVKSVEAD